MKDIWKNRLHSEHVLAMWDEACTQRGLKVMPTIRYGWDYLNDNYLVEKDGTGSTVTTYTNQPGTSEGLVSQRLGNTTDYFLYDAQHSTRHLTDIEQAVTAEFVYSAFGDTVVSSGLTTTHFKYGGAAGYCDTGIEDNIYVRRRIYGPSCARWLSADPYESDVALGSTYTYVANSPVMFIDPSGMVTLIRPKTPNTTCNFKLMGFPPSEHTPPGIGVIYVVSSLAEIINTLKYSSCCNIAFYGHQGGPEICGGLTIWPQGHAIGNPRITVFPNLQFEHALNTILCKRCKNCTIGIWACTCANDMARWIVRQGIADATGCTVIGAKPNPNEPDPTGLVWWYPLPDTGVKHAPPVCSGYNWGPRDLGKGCWGRPAVEVIKPQSKTLRCRNRPVYSAGPPLPGEQFGAIF